MKEVVDWAGLNAALDKVARAHNALRARVAAVEEALAALDDRAAQVSASPSRSSTYGTYVPSPLCAQCDNAKEPGRTALTCRACSAMRSTIIRDAGDRSMLIRDTCFSCEGSFKPQTRYLCPTCTTGHKHWVADQRSTRT